MLCYEGCDGGGGGGGGGGGVGCCLVMGQAMHMSHAFGMCASTCLARVPLFSAIRARHVGSTPAKCMAPCVLVGCRRQPPLTATAVPPPPQHLLPQ